MASVITCSLSSNAAHSAGLGRKQGRCNNATVLLLSSPSPWASRVVGNALASPISCKRTSRVSPRASVQPSQQILTRKSFPPAPEFVFGAGTASYQIEGAWDEGGKGPSVWDHYCHTFPERIVGGSNGDVAVDAYHMYEEDVKMLKAMGMDAYRFSISWPRILPDGTLKGSRGVNKEGIQYYNNLINTLIKYGIKPYVTLFHWETPQALHEDYGAFLSRRIVDDYKDYASVCFEHFGDRVKNWFTFNEPYVFCCNAYGAGKHAPGRCSHGGTCAVPQGNSLVEPYTVGHNLILAHAEAAQLYMEKYKGDEGKIGMSLVSMGYEPYDKTQHIHVQAQERSIDFHLGWFLEPLFRGDYPFSMRALVRERLPHFTDEEKKRITGSYNMMGLNYYTSRFSRAVDHSPASTPVINTEDNYSTPLTTGPDGTHIGQNTGTDWLYMYPEGMRNLLMIIKDRYGNPPIYITENGVGDMDKGDLSMEKALNDDMRLNYLKEHIAMLKQAKDSGANVHGHFTWSLVDNFEWQNGYTQRFGLIYVDRKDKLKRHMKKSAKWFAEFNGVSGDGNMKVDSSAVPRAVPAAAAAAVAA